MDLCNRFNLEGKGQARSHKRTEGLLDRDDMFSSITSFFVKGHQLGMTSSVNPALSPLVSSLVEPAESPSTPVYLSPLLKSRNRTWIPEQSNRATRKADGDWAKCRRKGLLTS